MDDELDTLETEDEATALESPSQYRKRTDRCPPGHRSNERRNCIYMKEMRKKKRWEKQQRDRERRLKSMGASVMDGPQENSNDLRAKLIEFFKANPNPQDSDVHGLAERLGVSPHDLETAIYALLSEHISDDGTTKAAVITATLRKCGSQWCLYTKDGSRLLGKHDTKEKALAQERAIKAHGSVIAVLDAVAEELDRRGQQRLATTVDSAANELLRQRVEELQRSGFDDVMKREADVADQIRDQPIESLDTTELLV